ncbi:ATP-binding cassette domain-containing protein [Nocardioides aequoreus]|uniref:ATP-binding cassette domain-containing protein n=1 Tax=Nocardioides aequoreus TaxID=397278 RepID=UPI001FE0994E|nr:ATP-binding cassette domain-containing protein [Nocardioides aequoreus]
MRDAEVVERGSVDDVLDRPSHDYSRRLVAAEPARWRHPWVAGASSYAEGTELVVADGVTKRYGEQVVLSAVNLRIGAGERWSVSGPSGSGKSTLGNVLLGLTGIDGGAVRRTAEAGPGRCQKLYQDPALSFPPAVSLGRALGDVARLHGAAPGRLEQLLDAVALRPELLERRPGQVSGGELQRLAVVRAMLTRPALVLADEATSRLDLLTQERTTACLVEEVVQEGAALLWITHDADLAAAVAHRDLPLG